MSYTLILDAGSASPVNLVVQSAGEGAPVEIGTVSQSANGADRSSVRGVKRNFGSLTSFVDTATKDSILSILKSGRQLPCSGDLLGNLQTQCTVRYTGATMIAGLVDFWTVGLALNEVQPNVTLLRYAPGDTITGEAFTRSTVAYQTNVSGIYVSKAIDTKRDGHYIGGVVSTLLEGARTNSCLQSNVLTTTWTLSGAGTRTQDAVGLDGTANSATTIADTSAAAQTTVNQTITVPVDSNKHCASFYFKKDSDTTRFPACMLQISGGTTVRRSAHLNTQTGAIADDNPAGTGSSRVVDDELWWIVELTVTNNSTAGNTSLLARVYPAAGTVLGTGDVAATGSCIVGQVQVELNSPSYSSPIFTTTAAVARGSDSESLPHTTPPQEMTVYAKFVEQGTIGIANARVFQISDAAGTSPYFTCYSTGTAYRARHTSGGVDQLSTLAVAPAIGDTVELCFRLFGDGSIDITQSIDGAASTSGAQSSALPFASAWSGLLAWLNSVGTSAVGFTALQQFKVIAGSRSLDEIRNA